MGAVAITAKVVAHVALMLAAVFVYTAGLGIGLQVNPAAGTALWIRAAAIWRSRSAGPSGGPAAGGSGRTPAGQPRACFVGIPPSGCTAGVLNSLDRADDGVDALTVRFASSRC